MSDSAMSDKAVLVTGGAGYLGSHIALALLAAGRRVVVLDNLATGAERLVPAAADFARGDCGDGPFLDSLLRGRGIGAAIHVAAATSVPESLAQPQKYYLQNVVCTLALAAACLRARVPHFVFTSSSAVYGEQDAAALREDCPLAPLSPYGASKMMGETMLRDIAAAAPSSFRCAALRCFNIIGADAAGRAGDVKRESTGLMAALLAVVAGRRRSVCLYGDDYPTESGSAVRDYIHVADVAEAHLRALRHLEDGGAGGVFNCGSGSGSSVFEVVQAVERASGRKIALERFPRRPGDPARVVADIGRARRVLGFSPQCSELAEAVATALAWEARQP